MPVILFHAGLDTFSGGFVGVDVFFVISGYLITTVLIEDLESGRFSLAHFYERRARRILPALFFIVIICIPFAWLWMLPSQLEDFFQSIAAVSLFTSNILFWSESGYFDAAAEEKPLLHTWSLAVEEQYYLLFPLLLLFVWRSGRDRTFWLIIGLCLASLLLSEWGWRNKPMANFYLAPTRAWELLAGSIAAFVVQKHGVRSHNGAALAGLVAITFAIFVYDESTPFPSVYALLPVLGVVAIVLFADHHTYVARVLSTRPLVGIGLISYSAYLWHQPIFAFARIRSIDHPSVLLMLILAALSVFLAVISWKYVEQPFRARSGLLKSRNSVLTISFISIMLFAVGGLWSQSKSGHPERFPGMQSVLASRPNFAQEEKCFLLEGARFSDQCITESSPPEAGAITDTAARILLVGDSHAASLYEELVTSLDTSSVSMLTYGNCVPLVDESLLVASRGYSPFVDKHLTSRCESVKRDFERLTATNSYDLVIVLLHYANWLSGFEENGFSAFQHLFTKSIQRQFSSEQLLLLGPLPVWEKDVPRLIVEASIRNKGIETHSKVALYDGIFQVDDDVRSIGEEIGSNYVSLLDQGCSGGRCIQVVHRGGLARATAFDYGHLTTDGASFYAEYVSKEIRRLLSARDPCAGGKFSSQRDDVVSDGSSKQDQKANESISECSTLLD